MVKHVATCVVLLACFLVLPSNRTGASTLSFTTGDIVISMETGQIQWRLPDGTLNRTVVGTQIGTTEGLAFDAAGNLYVARWCTVWCGTANTVEVFNNAGIPMGTFGSDYCSPRDIVFDAAGAMYVGQAGGCGATILKFAPGQPVVAFPAASENYGAFSIDLAPDGCTMFYTSWGVDVKRYDVCTGVQLPNFNVAPLPSRDSMGLRVLDDGSVVVASGSAIVRLGADGAVAQTYAAPDGEPAWFSGLDLVGDGTFWVANYETSNVYRFDITTGALIAGFNAGTPTHTLVSLRVRR